MTNDPRIHWATSEVKARKMAAIEEMVSVNLRERNPWKEAYS